MKQLLSLLRFMVVGSIVNNRVVVVTGLEGDLVIGRNDEDFDEKLQKVHDKMRRERNEIMWEKRRRLLEELKKENISVELDSEDTRREIEGDPTHRFGDITIPPNFFDDLPLPTVASTELDNPEFSREMRKLYRSIESIDGRNETEISAISDLVEKAKIRRDRVNQKGSTRKNTIPFNVEPFDPNMPSEEMKDKIKSFEAREFLQENSKSKEEGLRHRFEKMPIFRSEYLDSFVLREGKRSDSESEPDDPSIYDFEQPTEDPIEKFGKIDLDLVKLFSLEKNESLKQMFMNHSRKIKKQKRLYLRNHANTTLIDFEKFKLPKSDESMEDHMITYDNDDLKQTRKLPDVDMEQNRYLAEYFTDHSWSSGDSHVNTFEFYDELQRVNFDITKNKKLMAIFQTRRLKNETIRAKIEEKVAEKGDNSKEKQTKQKRTTKTQLNKLIEDIEQIPTRIRTLDLEVTKRYNGMKTASAELRKELEMINQVKGKVIRKKIKSKIFANKTSKNTKRIKSVTKIARKRSKVTPFGSHEPFHKILNKYTLPKKSLKSTLLPTDTTEVPASYEQYTLKNYDLKDFGINMDHVDDIGGIDNKLQAQSRILYENDLSHETKKQIKKQRNEQPDIVQKKRKKRNIIKNNHNKTIDSRTNFDYNIRNKTENILKINDQYSIFSTKHKTDEVPNRNSKMHKISRVSHEKIIPNKSHFSLTPTWYHQYTLKDYDLKNFGMDLDEPNEKRHEQSGILNESDLSEETRKQIKDDEQKQRDDMDRGERLKRFAQSRKYERNLINAGLGKKHMTYKFSKVNGLLNIRSKRQIRTDEEILKKYTKNIDNVVLQKRFQKSKNKNTGGNLGLVDEKELRAKYKDNSSESVTVMSVEYNEEVLKNLMGLNGDDSGNDTCVESHHIDQLNFKHSNETFRDEKISRSIELDVDNVEITTERRLRIATEKKRTKSKKEFGNNIVLEDDTLKQMNQIAKEQWNPMAMLGSYESEQTDKSFYNYFGDMIKTTALPLSEMIESQANDSVIDSFIRRKEEATRRANLLRDLIITRASSPSSVTYKTRRTYNRRALVNCTGHVVDHRFNLLIPAKIKRTQNRVYITEYPRYNLFWYYSMWPNYRKLIDKYTINKGNTTAKHNPRKTKYPQTMRTIYITKKKTTHLIDRILYNLYNSTKYANTKYYKPSFNSDLLFQTQFSTFRNSRKKAARNEAIADAGCGAPNGSCGCMNATIPKTKKTRNPNVKRRLHYVKTKLEILENNDLIDNKNWGMVVFASNFTRSIVLRKLVKTPPTTEWHVSNVPMPKNLDREKAKQERLYNRYYGMSTLTPLPWVEDNIRRVRIKEAQRAQEELDYKGEYDVKEYAEYLGLNPDDFFNGETPPFKVEPLQVVKHDLFDNTTDFTYPEYEIPTDPTFTFDPVYHDNVVELEVMRRPTRTTFDPTAMNHLNYKRFYTLTSTRKKDRSTWEYVIWTERTFRARFRNEGTTELVPVYTCHQCPARFLNNEDTDGENLLMRHFLKHQNLEELYYPIGWRFEKNRTRWYNNRVRRYFLRLLREQDVGLSAMAQR